MKEKTLKSVLAGLLAVVMTTASLAGCSGKKVDENGNEIIDRGAEINMYVANFPYDLDPGRVQFDSDLQKYYSLIYESLFKIDESGKLKGAVAKEWKSEVDERDGKLKLQIKLASTSWSDGVAIDADDVVYTFKRILDPDNSNPAASLLYPIENAKAAKSGLVTIDDVGFSAINTNTVEIIFEEEFTDVDYFLRTLANPVFTPLREDIISNYGEDWAQPMFVKAPRDGAENVFNSIVTNGPFTVKEWTRDSLLLERSTYYRNLGTEQKLTKYVTPYRIIINFRNDADKQLENYALDDEMERVFLVSSFTKDGFEANKKHLKSFADASSYTYYFNADNKTLSDERVRKALSIALDRNEIAAIVGRGVTPATGYVPTGIESDSKGKKEYRSEAGEVISASANLEEAKSLVASAGVRSGNLTLTIRNDFDWEAEVAEYAASVWKQLGFNVKVSKVNAYSSANSELSPYEEKLASGDFDIIGFDYCALSSDAYSFLVPYAREYSGSVVPVEDGADTSTPHVTGFDDAEYNALIAGTIERNDDGEIVSATGILGAKNAKERFEIYKQAETMLAEKVPSAPLFFGTNSYLVSNKLSGVKYNFVGAPEFAKVKLSGYEKYKISEVTDKADSESGGENDGNEEEAQA